jgi:septal ring factor EnvC (AmiA/AmiB activator)
MMFCSRFFLESGIHTFTISRSNKRYIFSPQTVPTFDELKDWYRELSRKTKGLHKRTLYFNDREDQLKDLEKDLDRRAEELYYWERDIEEKEKQLDKLGKRLNIVSYEIKEFKKQKRKLDDIYKR